MTASVARLHAGDGYTYLTRQVATGDVQRERGQALSDYYTADGCPPGRWRGAGLASLGVDGQVSEAQMKALFGEGLHPNADQIVQNKLQAGETPEQALRAAKLGRKYPAFDSHRAETWTATVASHAATVAARDGVGVVADLSREQRREARLSAGRELFWAEKGRGPVDGDELDAFVSKRSRPTPQPVSGFDVTFTPVKSVSVLWGVGDDDTRRAVEEVHAAAVEAAVAYIEAEVVFTRTGSAGVAQEDCKGVVAASFDHFDSRTGDPNLHTHVAIANRVQGTDGRWRTLDGRTIFAANVTFSEVYNTAVEDGLRERLGVEFEDRQMGPGKRPVREVAGIDARISEAFSTRRQGIDVAYRQLLAQYRAEHGHEPGRAAQIELAQQATLDTRNAKGPMESLASKRTRWRADAELVVGADGVDQVLARAQAVARQRGAGSPGHPLVDPASGRFVGVDVAAASVVRAVSGDRATWKVWHLRGEANRQLRGVPGLSRTERARVIEQVATAAASHSVLCEPPAAAPTPLELQRANGELVFRMHGNERFTSREVLAAERLLVDAARTPVPAPISAAQVDAAVQAFATARGFDLDAGQRGLVQAFASADRQLVVGIGPAGTGKTQAMATVVDAAARAGRRVHGLAPSAAAARVFADDTGARADTLAKVLHTAATQGDDATEIVAGDLVVVDEAGMAGTQDLARLAELCERRGAVLRLLGDDQQLAAVAAGGALRTIAHDVGAVRLSELHRFTDLEEAAATLQLRDGDTAALGFYEDADRIVTGSRDALLEQAYTDWRTDRDNGRTSLMIAGDNATVTELSERARLDLVAAGVVEAGGVRLAKGSVAGVGDTIVTRMNDRTLALGSADFVKNGDLWSVTGRGVDGSLTVQHDRHGSKITLPADYVHRHVELGYATTVNRAQGMTVDVARPLVDEQMNREQLYVAMTRGRAANVAYTVTQTPIGVDVDRAPDTATSGRDVLAQVMRRSDEAGRSATDTIRTAYDQAESLERLVPEYEHAFGLYHRARVEAAVDQVMATRPDGIRAEDLRADPAYGELRARLGAHAAAGRDPQAALQRAVDRYELATAESPTRVLCHRLDQQRPAGEISNRVVDVPPAPVDGSNPALARWLRVQHERVEQRLRDLVERTRSERPQWATRLQGVDEDLVVEVAVFRDRHAVTDSVRPLGHEPDPGSAQHHQWTRLRDALEHADRHHEPEPEPAPAIEVPGRTPRNPLDAITQNLERAREAQERHRRQETDRPNFEPDTYRPPEPEPPSRGMDRDL